MLHLFKDLFKDILLRIGGEKSPAPGRNWIHDLSVTRPALYHCATTAAHEQSSCYGQGIGQIVSLAAVLGPEDPCPPWGSPCPAPARWWRSPSGRCWSSSQPRAERRSLWTPAIDNLLSESQATSTYLITLNKTTRLIRMPWIQWH